VQQPQAGLRVWRVTKYDPADRDERGYYTGNEDTDSDHGPVEAAYLAAVIAFAGDAGVSHLQIREPAAPIATGIGPEAAIPADYHDGADVPLDRAVELVRSMLRGDGFWCRLEAGDDFFVHVGWDQYVYIGSRTGRPGTVGPGLFAEPIPGSPYAAELHDEHDEVRAADGAFWAELTGSVERSGAALLEEGHVHNHSRWHRLTPGTIRAVRDGLTPRARLLLWPDLDADVPAALDLLPEEGLVEVVWQDRDGRITSRLIEESDQPALRAHLAEAVGLTVLSGYAEERHPLMTGVLPDPDGVLRARWAP
jgi:hypothetical protein